MADDANDSLAGLLRDVLAFRDARDWSQFHTLRHVAAALAIEAGELQEAMLWQTDDQVSIELERGTLRKRVADELADVMIFGLVLAHAAGIDPAAAIRAKLATNELKYPVDTSRGNATKYRDL